MALVSARLPAGKVNNDSCRRGLFQYHIWSLKYILGIECTTVERSNEKYQHASMCSIQNVSLLDDPSAPAQPLKILLLQLFPFVVEAPFGGVNRLRVALLCVVPHTRNSNSHHQSSCRKFPWNHYTSSGASLNALSVPIWCFKILIKVSQQMKLQHRVM